MKNIVCIVFVLMFAVTAAFAELIEGVDYYVEYKKTPPTHADVLHVNFISLMPNPSASADVVRRQLLIYGPRSGHKNVIGSAWHTVTGDSKDLRKMNFSNNLGAYVWIGSSGRIVPFNQYITILKNVRRNKLRANR
ncbi:MAG: hypothetical protein LBB93_02490 [Elusimicrobiota bacterium]|nr:hypothetical protein [Elusimicrobiota bacterium]